MRSIFLLVSLMLTACGGHDADTPTAHDTPASEDSIEHDVSEDSGGDADDGDYGSDAYSGDAADLLSDAAQAICDSMFRCCDDDAQSWFFQAWRGNTLVADRAMDMPPNASLSPETCPALVSDLMDRTWLGGWVTASESREIDIDINGAASCLNDLRTAACGPELREALTDRTCFSVSAPTGGEEQRRFLSRTATAGDNCSPMGDGFGGLYYGTCDPSQAFCCVPDETGACSPFPLVGDSGTCASTTPEGGVCTQDAPLQMCATGSSCTGGICTVNPTSTLALGEECYNPSTYSLLGDCMEGWCDLFGSAKCEAKKPNDDSCMTGEECDSDWCGIEDQTCDENPICNG